MTRKLSKAEACGLQATVFQNTNRSEKILPGKPGTGGQAGKPPRRKTVAVADPAHVD